MTDMPDTTGTDSSLPHHSRMATELAGSWHVLTGHAEMLAGATFADPEAFYNGVVDALRGDLEESIGDGQAQVATDAMRTQWKGLSQEAKGKILTQWGQWTDDPEALANGVVDLMQGKLDRYVGSSAREAGSAAGDVGRALSAAEADKARQALAAVFADRAE
jgi:uncharacterized protein YjbJ (UPF0337 family)